MSWVILGVLAFLVVVTAVWTVGTDRRLVRLTTQVDASWAQIDVQLKRRHSLIPELVGIVKQHAGDQCEALNALVAARAAAASASAAGPAGRAATEAALGHAIGRILGVVHRYPALATNEEFRAVHTELEHAEEKISYAQQFYTSAVAVLNETVESVPTNVVAALGRFKPRPYFDAASEDRQKVQVRF